MDTSCLFDVVEVEMTGLDETMVGTNHQQYSSLYQVETCVRVTPRRQSSGDFDRLVLSSTSDVVIVAVGNQLMLFGTVDRQLIAARSFRSLIDCVAFNDDGSLLVVAERAGDVHAIDGKTGELRASRQLLSAESDDDTPPLFKAVEFGGGPLGRLAVLTSQGQVHVVDGLQTGQLKHSVIDVANTTSCLTVVPNGDVVTADDSLNLWSSDDGEFEVISSCPLMLGSAVKCSALPRGDELVVLDSSGHLIYQSMARFVAISMVDCASVVDFVLVDRPGDSRNCVGTIAVLQKSEISSCISIYSLPSTERVYSVNVHQGALLFPSPLMSNDCVYFLEVRSEKAAGEPTDAVTGFVEVRRVAETDPRTRLRRLLAKRRFSEAESFAKKFNLDVQSVYREHAGHLAAKLSAPAGDVGDVVDELISELTRCLGRLDDVPFVVDCCISTALPELWATNQLLTLAHDRLSKSNDSFSEPNDSLAAQLREASRRLAAFQVTALFHLFFPS